VSQLEQRFQHEKRAQVCLWFDEKIEFARLLPALQAHLEQMQRPPFVLLEYDAGATHGQIWLKHRVYQLLSQTANAEARRRLRFVLYVPLSEDFLDVTAEGDDGVRLDLLEEYRTGGVLWRIGGKRPTLFSFLRLAGVALPDNATDQRRLWDGGRDSLLAKGRLLGYPAHARADAVPADRRRRPDHSRSRAGTLCSLGNAPRERVGPGVPVDGAGTLRL
jgi:hypothetical protein